MLLAEALDRISRDLEHVARVAKRVAFRGARIVTLSEGEIGALHIGLAGTMSQLYLEQLAEKTRRGLRGVVAAGRIPAGRAYGYRPTAEKGVFEIVGPEAAVIRRIFADYAAGVSPRAIAHALNAEGVPGPRSAAWKANTILGDRASGVGIINNRLYAGEIVWNRSTWRKDPETGRRRPVRLPDSEWVVVPAPEMRIVPAGLWQATRTRQGAMVQRGKVRRATRPLSGLLVCGCCGARLTILGREHYGCPVNKEQGPSRCTNGRRARAPEIERRVLDGLRTHLCRPEAVEAYSRAYVAERTRLRAAASGAETCLRRKVAALEREQTQIVEAIGKVSPAAVAALAGQLDTVAARLAAAREELAELPGGGEVIPIAQVSAEYIERNLDRLWAQLAADQAAAAEARDAIAALITRIRVVPGEERGAFSLEIEGDLVAFLDLGCKKRLVAGARNVRMPTLLAVA